VRAHALAPHRHRGVDLLGLELRKRADGVGRVDDHLVCPVRRPNREQVGLAAAAGERVAAVVLLAGRQGRVEVRDDAHAPAAVVAQGVDLGRGLVLMAGGERVALAVYGRPRSHIEERARARAALAGDDHPQPGKRIDAQLGAQSGFSIDTCSMPSSTKVAPRTSYPSRR
jgi:hypothetical protein